MGHVFKLSFSYFAAVQKLNGMVRITNVKYSPGFSNASSEEYQNFAQLFVDEVSGWEGCDLLLVSMKSCLTCFSWRVYATCTSLDVPWRSESCLRLQQCFRLRPGFGDSLEPPFPLLTVSGYIGLFISSLRGYAEKLMDICKKCCAILVLHSSLLMSCVIMITFCHSTLRLTFLIIILPCSPVPVKGVASC